MHAHLIMIYYYRGNGGWDSTNVIAEESQDGHITCRSFHLTCFAVLVDVSGVSRKSKKQVL